MHQNNKTYLFYFKKENTVIIGCLKKIVIKNILSFELISTEYDALRDICSICVLREDKVLLQNKYGEIICYNSIISQINFTQKPHNDCIKCILQIKHNKILSSSYDNILNIYNNLASNF